METRIGTSTIPIDTDPSEVSNRRANKVVDSMLVRAAGGSANLKAYIEWGDDHARRNHD